MVKNGRPWAQKRAQKDKHQRRLRVALPGLYIASRGKSFFLQEGSSRFFLKYRICHGNKRH
jgi:hypothetical protein